MAKLSQNRPATAYGSRRQSSDYLSVSPEKYPPRVEELVEKKIVSEYNFNKHARLRRIRSDLTTSNNAPVKSGGEPQLEPRRHRGDENLTHADLTVSLPARMSRLDVNNGRRISNGGGGRGEWTGANNGLSLSGQSSPANRSRTELSRSHESDEDLWSLMSRGDQAASNVRRRTMSDQLSVAGGGNNNNHPKLTMMKKKLSPLPNRHRMKSLPCNDDDLMSSKRDLSPA